jgi:hypothetical protein
MYISTETKKIILETHSHGLLHIVSGQSASARSSESGKPFLSSTHRPALFIPKPRLRHPRKSRSQRESFPQPNPNLINPNPPHRTADAPSTPRSSSANAMNPHFNDPTLRISQEDLSYIAHTQRTLAATGGTPSSSCRPSTSSSTQGGSGGGDGGGASISLDPKALAQLSAHFDSLLEAITTRVDDVRNPPSATSTRHHADTRIVVGANAQGDQCAPPARNKRGGPGDSRNGAVARDTAAVRRAAE